MPTLLLYPGLGLAGEYQKIIPVVYYLKIFLIKYNIIRNIYFNNLIYETLIKSLICLQQQQSFILMRFFSQCTGVNLAYGLPTIFYSTFTSPKHLPYEVPSLSYLLSTLLSISSWVYLSLHHHLPAAVSQFSLSNITHLSSQHDQTTSACFVT